MTIFQGDINHPQWSLDGIARLHRPHELGDLPRQSLDGVSVVLDLRSRAVELPVVNRHEST